MAKFASDGRACGPRLGLDTSLGRADQACFVFLFKVGGECHCKENYEGLKCDKCAVGTYGEFPNCQGSKGSLLFLLNHDFHY